MLEVQNRVVESVITLVLHIELKSFTRGAGSEGRLEKGFFLKELFPGQGDKWKRQGHIITTLPLYGFDVHKSKT